MQMSAVRNVLFIMADQLRWDYLGCTGHPTIKTPNIDRLASRGTVFDRGYVQSPVCGPSRMSFYTGRYVSSHRSTWIQVPLPLSEVTLGDYLRAAGRDLTLIGKSHFFPDTASIARLGGLSDAERRNIALEGGFEVLVRDDGVFGDGPVDTQYANYLRAQGYDSPNPWHDFANSAEGPNGEILSGWNMRHSRQPARVDDAHGETAYMTDRALEFIAGQGGEPWCVHLSYIKPHWPYIVSAPYHEMYSKADIPPVNRGKAPRHPVHKAFADRDESRAFMRDAVRDEVVPIYMGLVTQLDAHIGRLLDRLEEMGRLDDTLILFTSDHGDYLGDHWLGDKEMFHDASVRVPIILYDPRPEADPRRGAVSHALVQGVDILPTMLDVLGLPVASEAVEGISLLPMLADPAAEPAARHVFSEMDYAFHADVRAALGRPVDGCRGYMVFDGRWKYVLWEGLEPELFDLETDPGELSDLAGDAAHAGTCARLHAALFDWIRGLKARTTVSHDFVEGWQARALASGIRPGIW